jgi:signal transduction histidine kinase
VTRTNVEETKRGRAFMISIIGGVTLLLLATTVFAVASQARSVSREAEQSVSLIEDLRVVSVARAELSVAFRIDEVAPEQVEVIESTLRNAEEAMRAVDESFDGDTPQEVLDAFAVYESTANAQADLLRDPNADDAQTRDAEIRTGEAFVNLSQTLRAAQEASIEQLRVDNDLMNVIGTIATFVVAFIVPSAALYIFEALRRSPRHTRRVEYELSQLTNTSHSMAEAVAKEASAIRTYLSESGTGDQDQLHRSLLRLDHIAALNGSVRSIKNGPSNAHSIASEVARGFGGEIDVSFGTAEYPAVVFADNDQLTLIIYELVANATQHGRAPVRIEINSNEKHVTLSVTDEGIGLPEVIETAIIDEDDYAIRSNLLSGNYGFGLVACRRAADAIGGKLSYVREDGRTSMMLELARATEAAKAPETRETQLVEVPEAA